MDHIEGTFYLEKEIAIEPDLGDLRKSTDKALPAPPKTPKRVLMKYRFSAFFPIAFAVASFVLTLVLVLAGSDEHTFGGQYMVTVGIQLNIEEVKCLRKAAEQLCDYPRRQTARRAINAIGRCN
ncbi:hypothetical protein IG631_19564 [Alternaria alternata]|nr:hypothetical protein IG631_19564 [Alternaria alternata]